MEEWYEGVRELAGGMKEEMEIHKRWLGYERDNSEGNKKLKTKGYYIRDCGPYDCCVVGLSCQKMMAELVGNNYVGSTDMDEVSVWLQMWLVCTCLQHY